MDTKSILLTHTDKNFLLGLEEQVDALGFSEIKITRRGTSAFNYILRNKPSIVILDAELKDVSVFELIKTISEKNFKTDFILFFSEYKEEIEIIINALNIKGALFFNDSIAEIKACIKNVAAGKKYYSTNFPTVKNGDSKFLNLELLSKEELKTLSLLGAYKTSIRIAKVLKTSKKEVDTHIEGICGKLDLTSGITPLFEWAIKHNELITNIAVHSVKK